MEKALETVEPKPVMTTERARTIAKELMAIVKELRWSKKFGGEKEHLEIEAWQFIAAKEGATASITDDREIRDKDGNFLGFEASAALMKDGECLTEARHECTIEEQNWKGRPRYALRGMAQTRAMSRACRNRYAWIARMGGFAGTPADEMGDEFNNKSGGRNPGKPKHAPPEPSSEPESPPESPETEEKPESKGSGDKMSVYRTLLGQIKKKVIGTNNVEQAKMLVPPEEKLKWEHGIALVNLLATLKQPIEAEEWNKLRDEVLGGK